MRKSRLSPIIIKDFVSFLLYLIRDKLTKSLMEKSNLTRVILEALAKEKEEEKRARNFDRDE